MRFIFYILACLLIIGLFLYSKLTPYKDRLNDKYRNLFNLCDKIFTPVLGLLRKIAQPMQVGSGISVDMSQIFLLVILLVIVSATL